MNSHISVRDGAIYLPADVVDTYFRGIDAVIVLLQECELRIMPVFQATSGGYLLKRRNAAGDRVVQARDVFLDKGLQDSSVRNLRVQWKADKGALCADWPII